LIDTFGGIAMTTLDQVDEGRDSGWAVGVPEKKYFFESEQNKPTNSYIK
jgi:hypothetical protein